VKGIILAGGSGTRLYPATFATCKQLLPIYDKPMVYYPLSTLMLAGIREILIISTPEDTPRFARLFGDGSQLGLTLSYAVQERPAGLAEAFIVGASFARGSPTCLVLGDNLFYGPDLPALLRKGSALDAGCLVFGYQVKDPERYGVIAFDEEMRPIDIIEKPKEPPSPYAVPGIYFYGPDAPDLAATLTPSARGELEITDLNRLYLSQGRLRCEILGRGYAWLDTGTFSALHKASAFVQAIQERQGIQIACVEEIAYSQGYITAEELEALIASYSKNDYRRYLEKVVAESRTLSV
jgi:glucose-1-phosphate thymidylyltransferase